MLMHRAELAAAAGSPLTLLASAPGMPWWACVTVALSGPSAYICRIIVDWRLNVMAITKVEPEQVPALMAAITGNPTVAAQEAPASSEAATAPAHV
jgi:hypothetical protein